MDWQNASQALAAKLHPDAVKQRQQGGARVSYIEGWHAIAEANRIFGFDGWTRETLDARCVAERERTIGRDQKPGWGVTYTARVRVTVGGVIRDGSGAGHGIGADLGECHESALKEAETDAMKRALMTFGNPFGLALYDKDKAQVGVDLPPFDAGGAAARIEAKLSRCKTLEQLADAWKAEYATVREVEAADATLGAGLTALKDTLKTKLPADPARQAPEAA